MIKIKKEIKGEEFCHLRVFALLDGRKRRLYCRLIKERQGEAVVFRLYEDFCGRQWLGMEVGGLDHVEELVGESFEQRVAADMLALGINKYSG
jgi:hypothetical protein